MDQLYPHLQSALGIVVIVAIAWALSEDRRAVRPGMVLGGLLLQAAMGLALLRLTPVRDALFGLNGAVGAIGDAARAGTSFVFGWLGGSPPPFAVTNQGNMVSIFFSVLPIIMVITALSALLWHWRILPLIVGAMALLLKRTLGIGGAVGLGAAATVFLGNVEGAVVVRPYLARMTRTELFILMTVGMAVIAGSVFVLYATILAPVLPGALGHLLVASMMSLPAGIMLARVMVPGAADTDHTGESGHKYHSSMDAVADGTEAGLRIYLQVSAMLIVTVALVALANNILSHLPPVFGAPLSIERVLGWLFAPLVWLFGIPWKEAPLAGSLLGMKIVLTELYAYLQMAKLPAGSLDPRATQIMVYAMCGFANLASVGILIAGMSALLPGRREEIVPLSLKALVSGALASGLTGCMIGLLPVS